MKHLTVGDEVTTPDGIGKIIDYSNFVYTVKVGSKENLYGIGELKKINEAR